MLNPELADAFEKLRRQATPGNSEIDTLLQRAMDPAYWRSLDLDLNVVSECSGGTSAWTIPSQEEQMETERHLADHGYFRLPPSYDPHLISRMRAGIEAVRKAGWPAIFAYVFDEFWTVFRNPRVINILQSYLGAGYRQTADFWAYYVDPKSRGSGWPPHTDSPQVDRRIAIWIPLSDATVDNGCIYLLPQDGMPSSLRDNFRKWDTVSREDLLVLLHNVTPLPAAAGSILGWHQRLIHWGGKSIAPGGPPRISIAVEFLHENAVPANNEVPVFDPSVAPDFAMRIRMVAQMILAYNNFEPSVWRFTGLATKLIGQNP